MIAAGGPNARYVDYIIRIKEDPGNAAAARRTEGVFRNYETQAERAGRSAGGAFNRGFTSGSGGSSGGKHPLEKKFDDFIKDTERFTKESEKRLERMMRERFRNFERFGSIVGGNIAGGGIAGGFGRRLGAGAGAAVAEATGGASLGSVAVGAGAAVAAIGSLALVLVELGEIANGTSRQVGSVTNAIATTQVQGAARASSGLNRASNFILNNPATRLAARLLPGVTTALNIGSALPADLLGDAATSDMAQRSEFQQRFREESFNRTYAFLAGQRAEESAARGIRARSMDASALRASVSPFLQESRAGAAFGGGGVAEAPYRLNALEKFLEALQMNEQVIRAEGREREGLVDKLQNEVQARDQARQTGLGFRFDYLTMSPRDRRLFAEGAQNPEALRDRDFAKVYPQLSRASDPETRARLERDLERRTPGASAILQNTGFADLQARLEQAVQNASRDVATAIAQPVGESFEKGYREVARIMNEELRKNSEEIVSTVRRIFEEERRAGAGHNVRRNLELGGRR